MTQKTGASAFHYIFVHAVHAVHDINRLRMHAAEKGTNRVQKKSGPF